MLPVGAALMLAPALEVATLQLLSLPHHRRALALRLWVGLGQGSRDCITGQGLWGQHHGAGLVWVGLGWGAVRVDAGASPARRL
jgi:hypothetical protein